MFFPKEDAYPFRNLSPVTNSDEEKLLILYNKWLKIIKACINIKEAKIIKYENIKLKELEDFLKINLKKNKFIFKNRNFIIDENKMIYLITLMKKINIYDNIIYYYNNIRKHKQFI